MATPEVQETRGETGRRRSLLPSQLRLLCVSPTEPSWTVLALLLDKHGCHEPQFRWCGASAGALALLREETFECLIVFVPEAREAGGSYPLTAFLSAVATSGSVEPILVLTTGGTDDALVNLSEFDCEVLVSSAGWHSSALPVWIARAINRAQLVQENLRLSNADRRRASRERNETEQLLEEQRRILEEGLRWSAFTDAGASHREALHEDESARLPEQVAVFYQELLRTSVMMGSGNLSEEIRKLAQLLVAAGVSPRSALRIHLERVETLIKGLGTRSSRHVMVRADVLAMELMIQLGECYRQKSQRRGLGDYGIDLLHERSLQQRRKQT